MEATRKYLTLRCSLECCFVAQCTVGNEWVEVDRNGNKTATFAQVSQEGVGNSSSVVMFDKNRNIAVKLEPSGSFYSWDLNSPIIQLIWRLYLQSFCLFFVFFLKKKWKLYLLFSSALASQIQAQFGTVWQQGSGSRQLVRMFLPLLRLLLHRHNWCWRDAKICNFQTWYVYYSQFHSQ